jgi:hypothetical protein
VLVPGCFQPSQELERLLGHLRACGRTHIDEPVQDPRWVRVLADFDDHAYALLGADDADLLFGSEAFRAFSDRRRFPREVRMSYAQLRQHIVRWSRMAPEEPSLA